MYRQNVALIFRICSAVTPVNSHKRSRASLHAKIIGLTVALSIYTPFSFAKKSAVTGSVNEVSANGKAATLVLFAGSAMTASRAISMLEPSGMTFVNFRACGENNGDCVHITATKRNGNLFEYLLNDQRCFKMTPGDTHRPLPDSPTMSVARKINKQPSEKTINEIEPRSVASTETGKKPNDFCIYGNRVEARTKIDNLATVTPDGHLFKFTHAIQYRGTDQWDDLKTMSYTHWTDGLVTPPGGMLEGWSATVLDEQGEPVGSDSSSWHGIEQSNDTSISVKDRCEARVDRLSLKGQVVTTIYDQLCNLGKPRELEVLDAKFNVDFCGVFKNTNDSISRSIKATQLDECFSNPTEFLGDASPNKELLNVENLAEVKSPFVLEEEVVSACGSSSTTNYNNVDVGDGIHCEATVRYECGDSATPGNCHCDVTVQYGNCTAPWEE